MKPHFAHTVPFDDLLFNLEKEVHDGWIRKNVLGNLAQYCYSEATVYERNWNEYTKAARGLILDTTARKIVGTPFGKFFNYGEAQIDKIPNEKFIAYEKLDGSLIIVYHHDGKWRCATKGSLKSDQAKWAEAHLNTLNTAALVPGETYLFEAIYADNRIVIRYNFEGLVLLGGYRMDGMEIDPYVLPKIVSQLGCERVADIDKFDSIMEIAEKAITLPANFEGWVLRFESGYRLKIKGEEYRRIHGTVSRITPIGIWEHLAAGDDMVSLRKDIPEEFQVDFDAIYNMLMLQHTAIQVVVTKKVEMYEHMSDPALGRWLQSMPVVDPTGRGIIPVREESDRFIFPVRKEGMSSKVKLGIWRTLRPTGNRLQGYTSSNAMNRIHEYEN